MVLLVQKLGRSIKFPSKMERHLNSDASSASSLRDFRSKISDFISEISLNSLTGLNKCFEVIHITNRALAKLVVEIDYPMCQWGGKLIDEYLSYTLNLMDLLNAVNSSVSHLNQAKLSNLHAVSLIKNSPPAAAKHLKKITRTHLGNEFKFERPIRIEERDGSEEEGVVLQALNMSKKIGILALGLVISGLCSDGELYMKIRNSGGGSDDSLIKEVDSRFCLEINGIMEEVEEVNHTTDDLAAALSTGNYSKPVEELKSRLKVLENAIEITEKQANSLFSNILSTRNKLIDNMRFSG